MALHFECEINKNAFLQTVSFYDFAHGVSDVDAAFTILQYQ